MCYISSNLFLCTPEEEIHKHAYMHTHTHLSMCTKYMCIESMYICMYRHILIYLYILKIYIYIYIYEYRCKESACNAEDPGSIAWVGKIPWKRDRLSTPEFLGFPDVSDGKESACNVGDSGSIPGLRRSPRGGHGNPFQYYCLENAHGQRSLVSYSPWGCKESDMTEQLSTV